ncbi:hypothetical protein EKG83_09775 [Saccharothrix syringae]|uniref:Transposase IS116/IS110/IS902 C-terminal domain-containing protein n=1 Tax=Saccharothrix syringae TaxID=103733 RepID=A0A5Q0GV22_SACSY|nr:hypothetical protein EKG83_09775 [Saccharothrix syringae]
MISELATIDRKTTSANKHPPNYSTRLAATCANSTTSVRPAARILGDVGDISRLPDRGRFASWNGTAPIDASSGDQRRHRLSQAGNHPASTASCTSWPMCNSATTSRCRAYYRRKLADGNSSCEAIRSLRNTPACAGSRATRTSSKRSWTEHPRVRGVEASRPAALRTKTAFLIHFVFVDRPLLGSHASTVPYAVGCTDRRAGGDVSCLYDRPTPGERPSPVGELARHAGSVSVSGVRCPLHRRRLPRSTRKGVGPCRCRLHVQAAGSAGDGHGVAVWLVVSWSPVRASVHRFRRAWRRRCSTSGATWE